MEMLSIGEDGAGGIGDVFGGRDGSVVLEFI